jgi:hypothetical protein
VYGQVVVLLLITSFRPLVIGVLQVAQMYGVRWAPDDLRWVWPCQLAAGTVVFFWLSWLVIARTTLDRVSQPRRLLQRGSAVACGAVAMYAAVPVPATAAFQREVALTVFNCTVAWLALEVCRAHGVAPGARLPVTAAERLGDWRIGFAALLACASASLCILLLALLRWINIDGVPVMEGSQLGALGIDTYTSLGLAAVTAVAVEDVVIVAGTTALLTAIRRPAWEIYTLICLLEILLHAYFGLAAVGMTLYAAGRVWLYRRYRRLVPLVAAHAAVDLVFAPINSAPLLYRLLFLAPFVAAAGWSERRLTRAAQATRQTPSPAERGVSA